MANRRLALLLAALLALVPVPASAAAPGAGSGAPATSSEDAPRPFTMSLNRASDFVQQTNFVQCVGASMQMMINIIESGSPNRTAKTQLRLQQLARRWSGPAPSGRVRQGASVRGWAAGLTIMGVGPYKLVGETSLQQALKVAAKAMRETGKPVGLLMWRGRHAWVMSGFRATADPAKTNRFTVTGVNVMDPLYPHGSSVWGRSPRPGELLTPRQLGKQFLPRRSNRQSAAWLGSNPWSTLGGKYVLVVPYEPRPIGDWSAIYR